MEPGYVLLGIALFILVFFLLREVMCWYWKINELLKIQNQLLNTQTQSLHFLKALYFSQKVNSINEIIVQSKSSGEKKTLSLDEYIELKVNQSDNDFFIVK